jgi:hypothetical protein
MAKSRNHGDMEICTGWNRHKMDPAPGSGRKVQFGIPVYWRCDRCHTERVDVYSVTGKKISQKYYRPDDYQEHLEDVRLESPEEKRVRAFKIMRQKPAKRSPRKGNLRLVRTA